MQAPAVAGRDTPRALAIPIRATPMVATEPQEVPVTTETTASIRNAVTSMNFGFTIWTP